MVEAWADTPKGTYTSGARPNHSNGEGELKIPLSVGTLLGEQAPEKGKAIGTHEQQVSVRFLEYKVKSKEATKWNIKNKGRSG